MAIKKAIRFWLLHAGMVLTAFCSAQNRNSEKPNIIIIYIDDLGYGDVSCYGATQVKTPHVDYLAKNGLLFTDAHCTAATCTPSRFSLLTGKLSGTMLLSFLVMHLC